ncbi:MAG: carrier protein [Parachlamydiales bacterium]|nr:carrier protein [Parachlamydiales bacterium]
MLSLRSEIASLTRSEKLFILFAMLTAFCVSGEYGITRPVSQSIFLAIFKASSYPAFWLATVPLNFAIVYLYTRFLPKIGPLRMMAICTIAVMSVNIMTAFLLPYFPSIIFFHFCWKDIYVLLMFKQLWSMIHSTISSGRAKLLFGAIYGVGMCGGVCGSMIPGFLAPHFGSVPLLYFSLPIYTVLFFAYRSAYYRSGAGKLVSSVDEHESSFAGFAMIARSRYLLGILLLVVFMQITVALLDYQFSHRIEIAIPSLDLRTAFYGKLIGAINLFSMGLQFIGSFLMIRFLGLKNSHYLIPLILCAATIGQWIVPGLVMITFAYSLTKSLDYSLFGIIREMLFLPLKLDEKFRAKAVIDVFAYRTSKALASFLLLGLQFFVGSQVATLTNAVLMGIFIAWIGVVTLIFKKQEQAYQV